MNVKRYAFLSALAIGALGSVTGFASAQNYKGQFTLPYEVRWGIADLQPGEYTVWTDSVGSGPVLHIAGANGTTATILTGPVEFRDATSGKGQIEVSNVDGTPVVTKFTAASLGREYSFEVPKSLARHGRGVVALKKLAIPVTDGK